MAIREIIKYPHPVLRKNASPITESNTELKQLIADMAETMYAAPGVGLAANQIGILLQVVVIDVSPKEEKNKLIPLINPQILEGEGSVVDEEGSFCGMIHFSDLPPRTAAFDYPALFQALR